MSSGDAKFDPIEPKKAGRESASLSTQSTTADLPPEITSLRPDHSVVERELPSQFHLASKQFRREERNGPRCGLSWEWPLTRDDIKERISLLDRAVAFSYRTELDELKAKMEKRAWHDNDSYESDGDEEQEERTFSSASESELGIHIAG